MLVYGTRPEAIKMAPVVRELDRSARLAPIVVLTGRVADNWLANWSRAEAAVAHPLDPIVLARTVADLLRRRRAELTTS